MSATPGTMLTLQQALALLQPQTPAARLVGEGATALARVHTDTRTLQPGDLFVALAGDRFDGHDYLTEVAEKGAAAVLVNQHAWPAPAAMLVAPSDCSLAACRMCFDVSSRLPTVFCNCSLCWRMLSIICRRLFCMSASACCN
mgnify:CR=1 FL=1